MSSGGSSGEGCKVTTVVEGGWVAVEECLTAAMEGAN